MQRLFYLVFRWFGGLLARPFWRLRILHRERARRLGAGLLVANHISHFDPAILTLATPRLVDWMAMIELFQWPIARFWLRAVGAFPVDRARVDRGAVRTALQRLRLGRVVGIFPEGGIRDGEASVLAGGPIRGGLGAIAQLSGAPVVPCAILGSDRLYAARSWFSLRRTCLYVAYGEPLTCPAHGKAEREQFAQAVAAALRALRDELVAHFQLQPDDWPQSPAQRRRRKP